MRDGIQALLDAQDRQQLSNSEDDPRNTLEALGMIVILL